MIQAFKGIALLGLAFCCGKVATTGASRINFLRMPTACSRVVRLSGFALWDQPAIQAVQWMSVAAMTDATYGAAAQAALSKVSATDQDQIKRRASQWVHAHQLEQQLLAFSEQTKLP